jgi:protein-tyrosine-phosphatase
MAEGFARTYGSDVLQAMSAGLAPAMSIAPLTYQVMLEKNIDIGNLFPKEFQTVIGNADLIINMSGFQLPVKPVVPVEQWQIRDPIGESQEVYREVRDQIEQRVMQLILKMRVHGQAKPAGSSKG